MQPLPSGEGSTAPQSRARETPASAPSPASSARTSSPDPAMASSSSSSASSCSHSVEPLSWPLTPASSQQSHPPSPRQPTGFAFAPTSSSSFSGAHTSGFSPSSPAPRARTRTGSAISNALSLPLRKSRSLRTSTSTSSRPSLHTPPPSPPFTRSAPPSPPATRTDNDTEHTSRTFMSAAISDSPSADEETCPICLELLSLRLAGEKPHVVPVCGHRLHHSCFEAVYGDVNRAKAKTSGSLGLCGVCRREMKVGEAGDAPRKGNKFAKLSGLPSGGGPGPSSFKMHSRTHGTLDDDDEPEDEGQDDELVQLPPLGSIGNPHPPQPAAGSRNSSQSTGSTLTASSSTQRGSNATYTAGRSAISGGSGPSSSGTVYEIVKPVVTVRAEHASVERSPDPDKKQHLTCLVTVEMPTRYPAPLHLGQQDVPAIAHDVPHPPRSAPLPTSTPLIRSGSNVSGPASIRSHPRSASPTSIYSSYAFGSTPGAGGGAQTSPFAAVVDDLRDRMADWKGHSLSEFGQLRLYDHIQVRKESATREFLVYLFDEAILCVTDDKRKGLNKLVDSVSGSSDKLRLKGRVYLRHVSRVLNTTRGDDLSLTITMNDDAVAEFVMLFKERTSLEVWKAHIEALLHVQSPLGSTYSHPMPGRGRDAASEVSSSDQSRLTSSAFSGYTRTTTTSMAPTGSVIHEEDETGEFGQYAAGMVPGYASSVKSSTVGSYTPSSAGRLHPAPSQNALNMPRNFTPLDLMLILSIPTAGPAALKTGIIKNSLEFLINHVGPRTRISIVAYSAGEGSNGVLRKTPFIAVGKADGKKRLEKAIDELGCAPDEATTMIEHQEERVNVVTACNLALDIILQRRAKSSLTGMVLLNDGRDGAGRQQMDLVMARAEAANVPIHAIGYGKSHDPSSLWLLSNHSAGSYTFVKDFYDLRDALAGCIGGILSIAATNVRLHIKVPEKRFFRIRKVSGTPGAIVSSTGTDVDVELGDLRFGERKDLIVEVEMSLGSYGESFGQRDRPEQQGIADIATATDAFFLSQVGINPSTMEEYNSTMYGEDVYNSMPDEAPLFEVNANYRDPAAGKSVSRLNHSPCLLTITINPPSSLSRQPPSSSAPEIVRRRMELLVSDMLSRALLLMTRRNDAQAVRLLEETSRIIATISATLAPANPARAVQPRRTSAATALTQRTLSALAEDVETVHEACLNRELFDSEGRYLAAQQAVVLRDQRSWTPRSATERLFFTADNALYLLGKSQLWLSA
ncbi:hypothetical protein JCM10207_000676 [Rhodosporidiobolus poonsookiae]